MNVEKFIKSIYLGDRYCIEAKYYQLKNIFTIQMDSISRVRSDDCEWNYYTDEDIINGILVFEGVKEIVYEPSYFEFNDEIYDIRVKVINNELYEFIVHGNYATGLKHTEGNVRILAKEIYLCDPDNPSVKVK